MRQQKQLKSAIVPAIAAAQTSALQAGWSKLPIFIACAVGLTACGLPHKQIAARIQQDIVANGGTSLKTVTCPQGIKPKAGTTFECVGEVDNGYTFTILVQQQDNTGNVVWDVPQAKGLVNLPKLEAAMKTSLTAEIGKTPMIACGGIYKAVTPGQGFECQLSYKLAIQPLVLATKGKPAKLGNPIAVTQTEKINVSTDANGNVNWQRILPGLAAR